MQMITYLEQLTHSKKLRCKVNLIVLWSKQLRFSFKWMVTVIAWMENRGECSGCFTFCDYLCSRQTHWI